MLAMSSCKEVMDEIKNWLVQGRPDADNLVDFPWEVEEQEDGSLRAIHPKFPIDIIAWCDDDIGVIRLTATTNYPTISLDKDERLRIYHKLLRMNAAPLAKFLLFDDDDYVNVAVDLSVKTLGKQEFNDALAMLIASVNAAVKALGLEEEFTKLMFNQLVMLVRKHIEEGWGRDRLVNYLVNRVGMSREDAEELINDLLSSKEEPGPSIYT